MNKTSNQLRWLTLTAFIFLFDYMSKKLVSHFVAATQTVVVLPFFNILYRHNTGAAFSFLNNAGGWQRWVFIIIALVISFVILNILARLPRNENWIAAGLACILGGAIGNGYDRLVYGYVIDFLDFHATTWHFATFNLADTAINIGVALWLIGIYKKEKAKQL